MTDDRLKKLRAEAIKALDSGQIDLDMDSDLLRHDLEKMVENARIYQAELEIQHRELQLSLLQQEEVARRYNSLYYAVPLPLLTISKVGLITDCNVEARNLLSIRTHQDITSHSFFRYQSDIQESRLYAFLNDDRQMKTHLDHFTVKTVEGDKYMQVILIRLTQDPNAQDYAQLVMIPEIKRDLPETIPGDMMRDLLNHSGQCFFVFDDDGEILFSNELQVWGEWVADIPDGMKDLLRSRILELARAERYHDQINAGVVLEPVMDEEFMVSFRVFSCLFSGKKARVFALTSLLRDMDLSNL